MRINGPRTIQACVTVCAVGLMMTPAGAVAQDDFELVIDPIVLEVMETDVDTNSSEFEEYRDLSSGFRIPALVIEGYSETSDRHLSIFGSNIWRKDARMTAGYGVWGGYSIDIDYNKIPHRFGNDGLLLWNDTGPGQLRIADSTQAQLQGALEAAPSRTFDLIDSLLQPYFATANSIDIALQRDRFDGRVDFLPMNRFSFAIDYKHENRTGNRQYGGSFGFNNTQELPEPIDFKTEDIAFLGEWTGEKSGAQFGYRYSKFDNAIDTLIWDNPFRVTDSTNSVAYLAPTSTTAGPSQGIYDMAPNNEAQTLFLTGRSQFAENWWVSGKISQTNLKQDDPLQAYTINTSIVGIDPVTGATFDPTNPANLPAQKANVKADLLSLDFDLGYDLGEDWKLQLMYDYYDYDSSAPRLEFDGYVRMHAVWEEVPRVTVPYGYTKENLGAKAIWDVTSAGRLSATYELRQWDRQYRETDTTDEDIFTLTYDHDFGPKWDLRARWEAGDRTYGKYDTAAQEATFLEPEGINNQPGLRKYPQANRKYDDYRLDVYFYPTDAVQLMFGLSGVDTKYPGGDFGLLRSELYAYNFEASYTPGESVNFYVFANLTQGQSFQRARQSGGSLSTSELDDWEATFDEDNDLFGIGLTNELSDRWTTDIVAQWNQSDGSAKFYTPPGGAPSSAQPIPNYDDYDLFFVKVKVDYEILETASVGAWYWYENYDLNSYLIENLTNYNSGLIAMNPNFADYTANVFGAYLSLAF